MKIGQKVTRVPETFYDTDITQRKGEKRPLSGKVVYIHPQGRYHTVEFKTTGGIIRESFAGVAD